VADSGPLSIVWRKSKASGAAGNCVEVALVGKSVLIRHSRKPAGPILSFSLSEWTAFLTGVRQGEFDCSSLGRGQTTD
jgi:hypothetical protein